MSKQKKSLLIVILGLLLLGCGFFIHLTNRYRLLLIFIGFTIQIFGMSIYQKRKLIVIPVLIILFASSLLLIDYIFVAKFNRLPVLAIRQTISKNVKIYNSAWYRVWKCDISDDKMYIDKFYQANYYCDDDELAGVDINEFILHFEKKFKEHQNDFIKIEGKISGIEGINSLEMAGYEFEVDKLNGYVTFDENVKLRFLFNGGYEKLSQMNVFDDITAIGKVSKLIEEDGKYIIVLKDSKIVPSDVYDDFEILVTPNSNCNNESILYYENQDHKYYSYCLDKMEIKYSESKVYDMLYILQDNKMSLNEIYKKAQSQEYYYDGGSILYKFENFNILKCNTNLGNDDVIFGTTDLTKTEQFCYTDTTPEESDEVVE